jgi:serine/threonine protein kinase
MDATPIPDAADPTQAATRKMSPTQMQGLLAAGGSGVTRELRSWQPPSVEDLQRMLPQYEITAFIAHGGMGAVYKGVQRSLDRTVAIKILPPDLVDDGEANYAQRFKQEARAMAKFKHFGIVTVYEAGEVELQGQGAAHQEGQAGTLLYFVMEFIEGTDVARLVAAQGRLTPEHALSITTHVCEALAYAHSRGVVHRDIKPSNVMIDADGQVKVADFGLAKMAVQDDGGLTRSNVAMGTPDFLAPESLIPGLQVDQRADLYAVGVMLYQMLTGHIPRGRFSPISTVVPKSDPKLDAIVDKAMQTDREKRYSTATELKADVERVFQLVPKERAGRTSWKTRSTALAAAAVIVLGAGGWMMWKKASPMTEASPPAATADPTGTVSIPGLPDLPPLKIPPGEPGLVKEITLPNNPFLQRIALLPDSRRLLTFRGSKIDLFDLETETQLWSVDAGGDCGSTAVSQDGSRFVHYHFGLKSKDKGMAKGQTAVITLRSTKDGSVIQGWTIPVASMSVTGEKVAMAPSGKRLVARVVGGTGVTSKTGFVALEEGHIEPVARWSVPNHNGHVLSCVDEDHVWTRIITSRRATVRRCC